MRSEIISLNRGRVKRIIFDFYLMINSKTVNVRFTHFLDSISFLINPLLALENLFGLCDNRLFTLNFYYKQNESYRGLYRFLSLQKFDIRTRQQFIIDFHVSLLFRKTNLKIQRNIIRHFFTAK